MFIITHGATKRCKNNAAFNVLAELKTDTFISGVFIVNVFLTLDVELLLAGSDMEAN